MVSQDSISNVPRDESGVVAALRAGDGDAFRQLVADLNPGLARLARSYVPAALADEVVQETWVAVVRSIDRFEERSSLKTWIYRIMMNKVRTLAGRESKIIPFAAMGSGEDEGGSVDMERLLHPDLGPGHWAETPRRWETLPAERLERVELLEMIEAAIAALPPAQREVVELRDVQGWSAEDVCNTLGISTVNQRVLLHRGRVAVRSLLEEYLANE